MNTKLNIIPILFLLPLTLISCEDTISPGLESADQILVVDAWLNDKVEDQIIRLSWSQPYLDNTHPPMVSGASVILNYEGQQVEFQEDQTHPGEYRMEGTPEKITAVFGKIGRDYTLNIDVDGESFTATSKIRRTVPVDSISFKFEATSTDYPDNSYTAEFWGRDSVGADDTYWIKYYKNGTLLNKPSELLVAYDASLNPGADFDGITFLPPVRGINPDDQDEDDTQLSPYQPGDSVYVEIHSITLEAFNFLDQVIVQTDRDGGFGELFSPPLANVSTNIANTNPNGKRAMGFFNVSAVAGLGRKLK